MRILNNESVWSFKIAADRKRIVFNQLWAVGIIPLVLITTFFQSCDLIRMKKEAARRQDLQDIEDLLYLQERGGNLS